MNNKQSSRYYSHLKPILQNKTVKTYSHIVFSLIAIIIFALFAIRPTIKTIFSLQQTLNDQQKVLEKLKDDNNKIAQGVVNYNQIDNQTKSKLFSLLPPATSVTCLIENLNNIATQSQTSITGVQIQPVSLKGQSKCVLTDSDIEAFHQTASVTSTLQEIPFTVNVQGNYNQLIQFLTLLGNSSRLVNVDLASFNKTDEGPLIISITSKAYFYQ